MLFAFLVSLLIVQATAAAAEVEFCLDLYTTADCTGDVAQSQCQKVSIDGSCQNIGETDANGDTTYFVATCTGTTLISTVFTDATCSGNGTTGTFTDGECTSGVKAAVNCDASSDPCFADTTTACRINDAAMAPSTAFKQCFGDEVPTMAERVPMKALAAGDLVLASPTATTRVIVNQHAAVEVYSNMVTLVHETGSLTLTPDHVVYADGAFQPAGNVGVGALLEPASKVTKVSKGAHGIVNPLTTSGTILAAGPTGAPVVSSALSEWIADLVLGSTLYPLPFSLAATASYLFPHSVQAFYDAQLEQFFTSTSTHLKGLKAAVPAPVALAILAAVDAACVGAFAAWALFSLKGATALVAVAAVAKSHRVVKA